MSMKVRRLQIRSPTPSKGMGGPAPSLALLPVLRAYEVFVFFERPFFVSRGAYEVVGSRVLGLGV